MDNYQRSSKQKNVVKFRIPISASLTRQQLYIARQEINQFYLGQAHCNEVDDDGNLTPIIIDPATDKKLLNAHHAADRCYTLFLDIELDVETGKLKIAEAN